MFKVKLGTVVNTIDRVLELVASNIDKKIPEVIEQIKAGEAILANARKLLSRLQKYSRVLRDLLKTEQV